MEQTLGQKRVKADFNVDKNELVDQLKNKAAEFIDLCEKLRGENCSGEKARVISIAQTEMESASHFAVKANYID